MIMNEYNTIVEQCCSEGRIAMVIYVYVAVYKHTGFNFNIAIEPMDYTITVTENKYI